MLGVLVPLLLSWGYAQVLSNCDPLDPSLCGLPFPNNFWLRENATTSRFHLQFASESFPSTKFNNSIDPIHGGWNDLDGFSPMAPCVTYFPDLDLDNVPHYWNITRSLDADCPTVILDTVTGAIVPHFAELDFSSGNDSTEQMFMVWPAYRLVSGRRYIVAMRSLLSASTGLLINSSFAFKALRDNIPTHDYDIESRRGLFADIFERLDAVGFDQSSLQLAWDFTIMSRETISNRMLFMRDDASNRVASGIQWAFRSVTNNYSTNIIRRIEGSMYLPQYVDSLLPGARLIVNASGYPVYQRMAWIPFTLLIPFSLVNAANGTGNSAGVPLHYGHGLFGERTEVLQEYLQEQAQEHGYLLMATDWIGLSKEDAPVLALMLATNPTEFGMVPDRCTQGMLHALMMMRLIRQGKFLQSAEMLFGGSPVALPNAPAFYNGNSNGGILGTVYMATTTDVLRGCLGVGAAPYGLLLPRSKDFTAFFDIIRDLYTNTLDRIHLLDVVQLIWNRLDPAGYIDAVVSTPLPNTPSHEVLLQHSLGDGQVSYVGAYTWGRSMGAVMFESNVCEPNEELWGFPFIADDAFATIAAIVTWQYPGIPPVPEVNIPPTGQDTHEFTRRQQDAQDMMYGFFSTGLIKNTCGGPCNGEIPPS